MQLTAFIDALISTSVLSVYRYMHDFKVRVSVSFWTFDWPKNANYSEYLKIFVRRS